MRALRRLWCRLVGHRFVKFADGFKRKCSRCRREEWLMGRLYPRIGEAAYFWEHMPFDELRQRRRRA